MEGVNENKKKEEEQEPGVTCVCCLLCLPVKGRPKHPPPILLSRPWTGTALIPVRPPWSQSFEQKTQGEPCAIVPARARTRNPPRDDQYAPFAGNPMPGDRGRFQRRFFRTFFCFLAPFFLARKNALFTQASLPPNSHNHLFHIHINNSTPSIPKKHHQLLPSRRES